MANIGSIVYQNVEARVSENSLGLACRDLQLSLIGDICDQYMYTGDFIFSETVLCSLLVSRCSQDDVGWIRCESFDERIL